MVVNSSALCSEAIAFSTFFPSLPDLLCSDDYDDDISYPEVDEYDKDDETETDGNDWDETAAENSD